jgi:large subunit ribosomal protein L15
MLHNLPSAGKDRKRIGRGGSRGGTSGRGNKGQKGRSGANLGILFEGGQMPLTRRLPKRGFNNTMFQKEIEVVQLADIQEIFENGAVITREALIESGLIRGRKGSFVKVLSSGTVDKKLTLHTDFISKSAQGQIVQAGGLVHLNKEK